MPFQGAASAKLCTSHDGAGGHAIELYLKSLNSRILYHDLAADPDMGSGCRVTAMPLQRDHSLVKLYDRLSPGIREKLEEVYAANPVVRRATTIRAALEVCDEVFMISRYPFEDQWSQRRGLVLDHLVALVNLFKILEEMKEIDEEQCSHRGQHE
jgi:hypothetical protein